MKRTSSAGFTLIELVAVIVILGILAAVAIPRFVDLSSSARSAVGQSACGAIQTTAVMYYASTKGTNTFTTLKNATTVSDGGSFSGNCSAPVYTPSGGTAVNCATIPSGFCSGP